MAHYLAKLCDQCAFKRWTSKLQFEVKTWSQIEDLAHLSAFNLRNSTELHNFGRAASHWNFQFEGICHSPHRAVHLLTMQPKEAGSSSIFVPKYLHDSGEMNAKPIFAQIICFISSLANLKLVISLANCIHEHSWANLFTSSPSEACWRFWA